MSADDDDDDDTHAKKICKILAAYIPLPLFVSLYFHYFTFVPAQIYLLLILVTFVFSLSGIKIH